MNQKEILEIFQPLQNNEFLYKDIIPFKNNDPGFSIKREYERDLRFLPAITKSGRNDDVCLIKINLEEANKYNDNENDYLFITASKFSKYISNHVNYNFSDENCPTKESIQRSQKTDHPIDVSLTVKVNKINKKISLGNREISPKDVLDKIYKDHINNVTKGFYYKNKSLIIFSKFLNSPFHLIKLIITAILFTLFGLNVIIKEQENQDSNSEIKTFLEHVDFYKKVKLFEYETSAISIFMFATGISTTYAVLYHFYTIPKFLQDVLNNSGLTLIFGLSLIILYDTIFPKILSKILNFLIKITKWVNSKLLN